MNLAYRIFWPFVWIFVSLVYPRRTVGRENRPGAGAYLICGNHSSMVDPFLIANSMGPSRQIHFMAKAELFRIPVIGALLRLIGMFPVDREHGGAAAMKQAMKYLKNGEKVGMFPEGTRISSEEASATKAGAVRIAARMEVPIVPVYIPRKKRVLRFNTIVIGEPYCLALDKKASSEEFDQAANELMAKIRALGESVQ